MQTWLICPKPCNITIIFIHVRCALARIKFAFSRAFHSRQNSLGEIWWKPVVKMWPKWRFGLVCTASGRLTFYLAQFYESAENLNSTDYDVLLVFFLCWRGVRDDLNWRGHVIKLGATGFERAFFFNKSSFRLELRTFALICNSQLQLWWREGGGGGIICVEFSTPWWLLRSERWNSVILHSKLRPVDVMSLVDKFVKLTCQRTRVVLQDKLLSRTFTPSIYIYIVCVYFMIKCHLNEC